MHNERYYFEAYDELFEMFDGSKPYNLLRAEYLLEKSYIKAKNIDDKQQIVRAIIFTDIDIINGWGLFPFVLVIAEVGEI